MTTQKATKPKVNVQNNEVEKEEKYLMDPLFDTLWDQYEGSLTRLRESREQRLDAYVNVLKETRKFNEEYRNTVKGLFGEVKNLNSNLKERSSKIKIAKSDESIDIQSSLNQFEETVSKFGELLTTPIKASVEIIVRVEEGFEQSGENYIASLKERDRVWSNLNDQYLKQLRIAHTNINHRIEDSFRVMFAPLSK